ncbi:MAG: gliding motility lipoprotein GldH [Chitinophagales bacterium]|nr:gliding motility lipoprotein GldH [Chitinophagales bacterium]
MKFLVHTIFLLGLVLLSGCNPNVVFEKNQEIEKYVWNKNKPVVLSTTIEDTTLRYNISVNIRHANFYEYSNLWMMVYTTFPDGKKLHQRIEFQLAETSGKWQGDCTGDICDINLPIQQNARFEQPGKYTFEFEQIMRQDLLPGIMAVGLKIEKLPKK